MLPALRQAANAGELSEACRQVSTIISTAGKLVPTYRFAATLIRPSRAERRRVRLAEQRHRLTSTYQSALQLVRVRRHVEHARARRQRLSTRNMMDGGRSAPLRPLFAFLRRLRPRPSFDFLMFRGRIVTKTEALKSWREYCTSLFASTAPAPEMPSCVEHDKLLITPPHGLQSCSVHGAQQSR